MLLLKMRGGSGATGPASSSGGAGAKGNLKHQNNWKTNLLNLRVYTNNTPDNYGIILHYFPGGKNSKDRKYVMTTDDLANAMDDQGITVKKPPYFI